MAKPDSSTKFTPENIVSRLARCLPYSEQVEWIDLGSMEMRFQWRGKLFQIRVDSMNVEEVDGRILSGSNEAMLIEALLKKQWLMEGKNATTAA